MFVITTDQRGSRRHGEQLLQARANLAELITQGRLPGVERPFERTVGDEMQAVLSSPETTVVLALHLQRLQQWSVGIGVGEITTLASSSRASEGPAFVHAREAVELARSRAVPAPIAVAGQNRDAAGETQALLQLMAAVIRKRSHAGWEMVDARRQAATARRAAEGLGITPQAASQRLSTALWEEVAGVEPLAARLLGEMDQPG